jgi:hypothetical protein
MTDIGLRNDGGLLSFRFIHPGAAGQRRIIAVLRVRKLSIIFARSTTAPT